MSNEALPPLVRHPLPLPEEVISVEELFIEVAHDLKDENTLMRRGLLVNTLGKACTQKITIAHVHSPSPHRYVELT